MILIGIGANLPSPKHGAPGATCGAALAALEQAALTIAARSRWYKSAPVPASDQPWFVNGVVRVKTTLDPTKLMTLLLRTEEAFGRRRGEKNAPRVIDLDLLAYGEMVVDLEPIEPGAGIGAVTVPHPRLHERAFVLLPLRDVAPDWRHPVSGLSVDTLIDALPPGQQTKVFADGGGAFGTEWRETATNGEDGGPSRP